jgi:TolB-like protein/Tfp pilus assembly protein PilF
MSIFRELKRRNVLRVGALYGAVAWLLLQIADVIVEPLGLPAWTMRMLIVLITIGFVLALVVAWTYELTPEGLVPDAEALPPGGAGLARGRLLDFVIIGVLCAALAYFLVNRSGDDADASAPTAFRPPTLAVLPFQSLSTAADDGYFADGLSEELLNLLAGVEGLRVAGRTSSFYFKGRDTDLQEIGRQLGVAHILEGSVRRSGSKIRVTAQLVDANDGFNLWSGAYDRELTDVLAIQDEIGRAVAKALQVELLGPAPDAQAAPRQANPQAYQYYLVARARLRERGLENLRSAVQLFDRAIGADRAFADAYAGKAMALLLLSNNHDDGDPNERHLTAQAAIRRALELDASSSEALTAAGVHAHMRADFLGEPPPAEADRYFERALASNPRSTAAMYWYGRYLRESDPQRSLELMERVLEIDPLELPAAVSRAGTLSAMGRGEEASAEYARVLHVYPESPTMLRSYIANEVAWGRLAHAHALALRLTELSSGVDPWDHLLPAQIDASLGREAAARERIAKLAGTPLADWVREGMLAILDGDYEALMRIDRRVASVDPAARRALVYSALLGGRDRESLEAARSVAPQLFEDPPVVPQGFVCQSAYVALALERVGETDHARRVAEAGLATLQSLPGRQEPNDVACRSGLLQMSGRTDEAVAEFTRAVDLGFRGAILGAPVPIEDDPLFRRVASDPRMQTQLARIRADLDLQRREVERAARLEKEKAASG